MSTKEQSRKTGKLLVDEIKKEGNIYVAFLSDGQVLSLDEETLLEYPLYIGKSISESLLQLINDFQTSLKAYKQCLSLLAKRSYTIHQIWVKLQEKGLEEKQIKILIAKFIDKGLLDDDRYIKEYYETTSSSKCIGYLKVVNELKEKGISKEKLLYFLPNKVLEKKKACQYVNILLKRYSFLPSKGKYQKIKTALKQRGFENYAIQEGMSKFVNTDAKTESKSLQRDFLTAKTRYQRKYSGYELYLRLRNYLLSKGYRYEDIENMINKEEFNYE